jgi:hypothetical protein
MNKTKDHSAACSVSAVIFAVLAAAALTTACGGDPAAPGPPDAGGGADSRALVDSAVHSDSAVHADAQPPDAQPLDAQPPDAQLPDAQLPDAQPPDAQLPDAQLPDAQLPDTLPPDAFVGVPPALVNKALHLTGSCSGGVNGYSACYPGTPGRSNGCCPHSYGLSSPTSTLDVKIVSTGGKLELNLTGYTFGSGSKTTSQTGSEYSPGHFQINPAVLYGAGWVALSFKGPLKVHVVGAKVTAGFSGTNYLNNTSYCPLQKTSISCSWSL